MGRITQENILENVGTAVEVPKDLVSFENCPYHCNKGKIFDPYKHQSKPCPYCTDKRRTLLRQAVLDTNNKEITDSLLQRLNLKPNLSGISFDFSHVIADIEKPKISVDTYVNVKNGVEALLNKATLGDLPEFSMLFYFGVRCNVSNFIYPLLVRYYLANVEIAPLVTGRDIVELRHHEDSVLYGITYKDLLRKELCVIWLDGGYTQVEVDAVKGLMENRAFYDYPTIIIVSVLKPFIYTLVKANGDTKNYKHLTSQFGILYTEGAYSNQTVPATPTIATNSSISPTTKAKSVVKQQGSISAAEFDAILGT